MTSSSRKLLLLAGIVLVLIAVNFSLNPPDLDSRDSQIGTNKSADLSDQANSSSARPSRRRTTGQLKLPKPTHEYAKLKDFIIPELKLEKSTFKQALNDLRDHYYDVCQLTGEKPIHFKFVIHGTPIDPHTITITNRSFLKNLNILALLGGMEMTRSENIITIPKEAFATINSNDTPLRHLNSKSEEAYSDGEAQMLMRLLSQIHDSTILSSPTFLARPNEEETIEIIREVIFPSAANEGEFTKDWTGFKITVTPSRLGFGSLPKLTYDRGVLNNQNNSNAPISITHLKDRIENYIPENKVTIAPIQSDAGKITYLWVALEEVDAAGAKIKR